jgi:hypothetical protein
MTREYVDLYESLVHEHQSAERRARVVRLAPARRAAEATDLLVLPAAATDGGAKSG